MRQTREAVPRHHRSSKWLRGDLECVLPGDIPLLKAMGYFWDLYTWLNPALPVVFSTIIYYDGRFVSANFDRRSINFNRRLKGISLAFRLYFDSKNNIKNILASVFRCPSDTPVENSG